jgi:hypothetical protein
MKGLVASWRNELNETSPAGNEGSEMRCSCDPGDKLTTVCPHRDDFPDPPDIHCPCSCGDCDLSCDTQREVGASMMDPQAWEIVGIERVEGVDGSMG